MLFPASKLGDMIIGIDAHTIIVPAAPPVPLVPHPFVGPIYIWWTPSFPSFNVFVNGMPALTVGAKSISFHIPTPPGVWWPKLPCPAKFFITHYTTVLLSTLFSVVLGTVGSMTGTNVPTSRTPESQMKPPPDNPSLWAALQAQISSFNWTSIIRMLLPPVVLPIAEGDVNMASPTVTVNGGPMSFVGPLFAGSCSEIPIIPNANVLGFSNVMVGVTLKEILMQLAWNVAHGVANLAASKVGAKFGSWVSGEPVDMVSGAVWVKQTDFRVPGPITVDFTRSYINCMNEFGPLGYNWTHTYNRYLKIENDAIFYYNEQGRFVRLPLLAVGAEYSNVAESIRFEHPDKDTYRLRTANKQTLVFRLTTLEPVARLTEVVDPIGNQVRLEYTGSRLVRLIDAVDRRFTFHYNPLGLLSEIRFNGKGKSVADWRMVSFEYNAQHELTAVHDRANHARRYSYNEFHWLTRHTNRNNFSVYYEYDNQGQCVRTWADAGKYGGTAEYLTASRITRWTNTRQHTWTYFYNEQNLVTQIVDPLGFARKMSWNEQGMLTAVTDEAGFTTAFEYDERGNCTKKTDPTGAVSMQVFDDDNNVVQYTDAAGVSIQHEFDKEGRLLAFSDEFSRRWEHRYPDRSFVHELIAPDGAFRRAVYTHEWSALEYHDNIGLYRKEEFDDIGNVIAVTDHRGTRVQFWNTPEGWVEEMIGPEGTIGRYTYDGEGNPTSFTDAAGAVTRFAFEGLNRAVGSQTAAKTAEFYAYEPVDEKLREITDAEGQKITITYDACERMRRQEYFDGRWVECDRDGRGLATKLTFSSGLVFDFVHDELGRTVRWEASDGTYAAYGYDALGRCVRAENADGALEFAYDPGWQLLSEKQGDVTVQYEYDVHGNITARTNSLTGRRVAFEFGPDNRLRAVRDGNGGFQEIIREDLARRTIRRFSSGVEETILRNQMGDMQRQTLRTAGGATLVNREYMYDKSGMISEIRDQWRGALSFEYDAGSRLIAAGQNGTVDRFAFDGNGNVIQSTALGQLSYGKGNRIAQAGPMKFGHDENGNVTAIDDTRGQLQLSWDALGRLTHSVAPDGVETEYGYDAIGRRTFKKTGDRTTRFYWQDFALMVEDSGEEPVEYVILPGSLTPMMSWRGGKLHHFVLDHLGTVQEILGPAGDISWQGRLAPWGELVQTSVARFENNIRRPGQYYDRETNLHYNVNRYYEPRTGRYLTPDPAGLAAGLNQYAYASNPVLQTDPFGLSESRVPKSPNAEINRMKDNGDFGTACKACGRNCHGPGGQTESRADHIVPYSVIKKMDGYDDLTPENKARIQNDPENFTNLCKDCNESRGNKPYGNGEKEFSGREDAPMDPRTAAAMKRKQDQLEEKLQQKIQDMLKEQADEEQAAKKKGGGCS